MRGASFARVSRSQLSDQKEASKDMGQVRLRGSSIRMMCARGVVARIFWIGTWILDSGLLAWSGLLPRRI